MTPHDFVARWQAADLSERAACQSHFADLCAVLGQPKPTDVDPTGAWYAFEKGVDTADGKKGWADVWLKGKFGWEYKRKHRDLRAAYQQLLKYREALENPPLLIVCDLDRFEVHTNFTGYATRTYAFDLEGLKDPRNVQVLRLAFTDPDKLRPDRTQEAVTREIADSFAELADGLRARGEKPERAAHFLMKLMFCMFAEDIDLLPRGLFTETVASAKNDPARLSKRLKSLFRAMADGGDFGAAEVAHFNGGLFADDDAIDLKLLEIVALYEAARRDWSSVEPSIFGTLFERMLDPGKRSQLGAHYTSRSDIETLLRPVLEAPLRREWEAVRARADTLFEQIRERATAKAAGKKKPNPRTEHDRLLTAFHERLAKVTVLDPACGSGNFLYVALHMLLDLEKEVRRYAADHDTTLPQAVRPTQLRGLEINEYAQQLAQEVIWIGFLQWIENNGEVYHPDPILDPLDTIRLQDAILDLSDPANPTEPEWPAAEFIVGNPPFLGSRWMPTELGDKYVRALQRVYGGRVARGADLCCYWFEKALDHVRFHRARAGLLATQAIRKGSSRKTLDRVHEHAHIFFAISDQQWMLDGAAVRISMVGFARTAEEAVTLDGRKVRAVNADLTSGADITSAVALSENLGRAFQGTINSGPFDIDDTTAVHWLSIPNPHGRPNSDVIRPWLNGNDIVKRREFHWIIDFGIGTAGDKAALFEKPFEYLSQNVRPGRDETKYAPSSQYPFWQLWNPRQEMRSALSRSPRFLATSRVSKFRVFAFFDSVTLPDARLVVFAPADEYLFGLLHARIHAVWFNANSSRHGDGDEGGRPTYNLTTCFETFPFPDPPPAQREAIAAAAKELDALRTNWLNPPEWTRTEVLEFPGSIGGPWKRYVHEPDAKGIGTVRYPRVVPKSADFASNLKKRTLTNLYNERPAWLANAHRRLDEAVFAAYGWPPEVSDDELLARLLALNLERSAGR